jgi:hypothetical protein
MGEVRGLGRTRATELHPDWVAGDWRRAYLLFGGLGLSARLAARSWRRSRGQDGHREAGTEGQPEGDGGVRRHVGEKPYVRKQLPPAEQTAQILKRRAASKLPVEERYRPKWLMALQMLDELAGWGLRPPVLVADAGYGQVADFRQGLTERSIRYVVATTSTTTAQPGDAEPVEVTHAGIGKYPIPKYPAQARCVKDLAHIRDGEAAQLVHWRQRLPGSTARFR